MKENTMLIIAIILCGVATIVSIVSHMFTVINLVNIIFILITLNITIAIKYYNYKSTYDNDIL